MINKNGEVNNGAHFENAVVQQLTANGFEPYFSKKKNVGVLDFVIEMSGNVEKNGMITYLPIYMCYLLKEQKIGKMIIEIDMDGL